MKLLMIGHLLGDFYFQTNAMAEKKKKSFRYTALHSAIYGIVMFVVLAIMTGKIVENIISSLLIGAIHLLVDAVKCGVNKWGKIKKHELEVFFVDQLIYIGLLLVVDCLFTVQFNMYWIPCVSENILNSIQNAPVVILAFLICGKPAAIIVSLVFGLIPKTTGITEVNNESIVGIKKESVRIGAWIGVLEREIILLLGLLGQYGAIGFVVAAKSLARHSQLNDSVFAEKYLIGTLLSSFMALLCVMMCKAL